MSSIADTSDDSLERYPFVPLTDSDLVVLADNLIHSSDRFDEVCMLLRAYSRLEVTQQTRELKKELLDIYVDMHNTSGIPLPSTIRAMVEVPNLPPRPVLPGATEEQEEEDDDEEEEEEEEDEEDEEEYTRRKENRRRCIHDTDDDEKEKEK
jgi:hypothetical protein